MKTQLILSNYQTKWERKPGRVIVDTTSKGPWKYLSPFHIGPCVMYDGLWAKRMENAWQYSKVYAHHFDPITNEPNEKYWEWAKLGWSDDWSHRYPMGKGAIPIGSWWDGRMLDYVQARKSIYAPMYIQAVQQFPHFEEVKEFYESGKFREVILIDFDAYDYAAQGKTLRDVLNDPKQKMGHAFVLAMMLKNDLALSQMEFLDYGD